MEDATPGSDDAPVRLTQFTTKGGCGCKLGPSELRDILDGLPAAPPNADVLLGTQTPDDAGVYRIAPDLALVQTVDFFTPIVDDPGDFGRIAAANALSDVYATGGRPLTALTLLATPAGRLPKSVVARILEGGLQTMSAAGAAVLGGHTIDDPEPKFGYAVTGLVHPDRLLTKAAARPGDVLVLTKPLGAGVLTTALKRGELSEGGRRVVTDLMTTLNTVGPHLAALGVRCATDVTGFGLLGHAAEVAARSGVGLVVHAGAVPVIAEAWRLGERGHFPGGTRNNERHVAPLVDFDDAVAPLTRTMLCDAVTSGGLLIAVPRDAVPQVLICLREAHTPARAVIGEVTATPAGRIRVTM